MTSGASGVRRWGFYGLSFTSLLEQLREAAPDLAAGRVILAPPRGRGRAICAVKDGRSVDTTTGFSHLEGLPTGTQCGSLDPGVVLFLIRSRSYREVEAPLREGSGLLGISGLSGDVREPLGSENPRAAEAVEYFVYRAVQEIGSLTAALGGLDARRVHRGGRRPFRGDPPADLPRVRRAGGRGRSARRTNAGAAALAGGAFAVLWVIPADEDRVIAAGTWAVVRKFAANVPERSPALCGGDRLIPPTLQRPRVVTSAAHFRRPLHTASSTFGGGNRPRRRAHRVGLCPHGDAMTWTQRHRLRRYLNDSIWIGPCVGIVAAMVAARLVHSVDQALGWTMALQPDAARTVLITLARRCLRSWSSSRRRC